VQRRKAGIYEQSLVGHRQRERFGPEAVLESGDRLVATARDTKRLDDLVNRTSRASEVLSIISEANAFCGNWKAKR